MAKKKYNAYDHMAQLGKVTGLLEAQTKIQNQLIKEQKKLKLLEHLKLVKNIKDDDNIVIINIIIFNSDVN